MDGNAATRSGKGAPGVTGTDRYWFIRNSGISGKYWDILRWGNVPLAVLALTTLQALSMGAACSTESWRAVLLIAGWNLCFAAMMRPLVGSVLDVQADNEGLMVTGFSGRRKRVVWGRVGRVRVTFAKSQGPSLVIHETTGRTQMRHHFSIAHPGPGTDAESFLLSKLAEFAPRKLTVEQLPASWREIAIFNVWLLGTSLIGIGIAAILGRYHFEPGAFIPLPAAVLLTVVARLRRKVSIEVVRGVSPNWDAVPRSCRAWVRALTS